MAEGKEGLIDRSPQEVCELPQAGGMKNIQEEGIVFILDFRLVITELYQPRLSHTAWRDNDQVIAIDY